MEVLSLLLLAFAKQTTTTTTTKEMPEFFFQGTTIYFYFILGRKYCGACLVCNFSFLSLMNEFSDALFL